MLQSDENVKASAVEFPQLPVLEDLRNQLRKPLKRVLERVHFVCVQHLLRSTGSLFDAMLSLGARPAQIHVIGKRYSTHTGVAHALRSKGIRVYDDILPHFPGRFSEDLDNQIQHAWQTLCNNADDGTRVVLLDDGGHLHRTIPNSVIKRCSVVGIEQTTGGLSAHTKAFPSIAVAASAAKRYIEPPLISSAILRKLTQFVSINRSRTVCGVIGLGHIGRAVAAELVASDYKVLVFDRDSSLRTSVLGAQWCDLLQLINHADTIFGCAGEDTFRSLDIASVTAGERVLASCSSEEIEFYSVLRLFDGNQCGFNTLDVTVGQAKFRLLRAGCPVNFDGSSESVPDRDIQVTRALLLGAIVQSLVCDRTPAAIATTEMLLPHVQQFVVNRWLQYEQRHEIYPVTVRNGFRDFRWIENNSLGEISACTEMNSFLTAETIQ
jgi:NAD(P)-dependent dehydrogenase (short-subunit alcohol dehydrogenase family)